MAYIYNVVKSPIKGKTGTLRRSSGYEYRDFWYTNASGQRVRVLGWHRALDITTLGTVVAFARGKVVSIKKGITGQTTNPSSGNSVTLLHANGYKTLYCHLDNGSNNHLNIGDIVEEGAKLGTDVIKTTGNSTGLHLHFGIYNGSQYVDPTPYLQGAKTITGYGGTSTSNTNIANNSVNNKYPYKATLKKGTILYNEKGFKYKNPCSKDRNVTVQAEVNGRYKIYGSTFSPHVVYCDKSAIKVSSKYPYNAVIRKNSPLYDINGNKYKNGTKADRNVTVQAEVNGRYKIYGSTFSPRVVYCDKSSIK